MMTTALSCGGQNLTMVGDIYNKKIRTGPVYHEHNHHLENKWWYDDILPALNTCI
jgi:hypothetical protein